MIRYNRIACLWVVLLLAGSTHASADLVFFSTGRALSVRSYRIENDTLVLGLRDGGEVSCPVGLVQRIEPDEVPYPEPGGTGPSLLSDADAVPYQTIIDTAAAKHGVAPALVRAVIEVESGYEANARSPKGAMGLMQLMPETAHTYEAVDPYEPSVNVDAGVRHLRSLLDRFDLRRALAAYNAGEGAVRRFGGVPPYRETQTYINRVLSIVARHTR